MEIFNKIFGKEKKESTNNDQVDQYKVAAAEIHTLYTATETYYKVGLAKFAEQNLEFKIEGKYAIKKDFNNKPGYHFAFEITSTEMTYMPEDYDDVCNYEDSGFKISVAYFDESPLTEENGNGIIIQDISNLAGTTLKNLSSDKGYDFTINTVETDVITAGEIKFVEWSDNNKIISFKFAVPFGLHDVVTGSVELTEGEN